MEVRVGAFRTVGLCWVNHGGCGRSGAGGVRGEGLGGVARGRSLGRGSGDGVSSGNFGGVFLPWGIGVGVVESCGRAGGGGYDLCGGGDFWGGAFYSAWFWVGWGDGMGGGFFGVGEVGVVVGKFASLEVGRACFDRFDFGPSGLE